MEERKTKTLTERLVWLEDNILAIIVFAITILLFVNVAQLLPVMYYYAHAAPLPVFSTF